MSAAGHRITIARWWSHVCRPRRQQASRRGQRRKANAQSSAMPWQRKEQGIECHTPRPQKRTSPHPKTPSRKAARLPANSRMDNSSWANDVQVNGVGKLLGHPLDRVPPPQPHRAPPMAAAQSIMSSRSTQGGWWGGRGDGDWLPRARICTAGRIERARGRKAEGPGRSFSRPGKPEFLLKLVCPQ